MRIEKHDPCPGESLLSGNADCGTQSVSSSSLFALYVLQLRRLKQDSRQAGDRVSACIVLAAVTRLQGEPCWEGTASTAPELWDQETFWELTLGWVEPGCHRSSLPDQVFLGIQRHSAVFAIVVVSGITAWKISKGKVVYKSCSQLFWIISHKGVEFSLSAK